MSAIARLRAGRHKAFPVRVAACAALAGLLLASCASEPAFLVTRESEFGANASRTLVVDLDDTVVDGGFWRSLSLYFDLGYDPAPFPDAAASLERLVESGLSLVFVTARPDGVSDTTLAWLDRHGFPAAPVVFSTALLFSSTARAEYKTLALRELERRGRRPVLGIGDKASDIAAYVSVGARGVLILESPEDPDLDRTLGELQTRRLGSRNSTPTPGDLRHQVDLVVIGEDQAWANILHEFSRPANALGR